MYKFSVLYNLKFQDKEILRSYIDFIFYNLESSAVNNHRHHILPKAKFPQYRSFDECSWNISYLSIENHIKAHEILTRSDTLKDLHNGYYAVYNYYKDHSSLNHNKPEIVFTDETRKKMSESAKLKWKDPNFRLKMSKKFSTAFSGSKNPNYDHDIHKIKNMDTGEIISGVRSELRDASGLTDQEICNLLTGNFRHAKRWGIWIENKKMFSCDRNINYDPEKHASKQKVKCPHCGKIICKANFSRWHGDNCKLKTDSILPL